LFEGELKVSEERQPQQWHFAKGYAAGRAGPYTDGRFATLDGPARFVAHPCRPMAEVRDARFPVLLTTGRPRDPRHAMSCTGTFGRLFAQASEPALDCTRRSWCAAAS
jgi:assimilatory nitrate reductase catalytic subunit